LPGLAHAGAIRVQRIPSVPKRIDGQGHATLLVIAQMFKKALRNDFGIGVSRFGFPCFDDTSRL
jgi:hypothetical protein